MAWNPALYMRHSSPRLEPALSLLSKTVANLSEESGESVRSVLDLGCGPGNITPYLCQVRDSILLFTNAE
jgi:trans-aconitate 2-methyltransferase